MRGQMQKTYTGLHRGLGCFGILLIGWFFLNLATQGPQAGIFTTPILLSMLGLVICIMLIIKQFTPRFFRRPRKKWHVGPVLLGNGFLTLVFYLLSQIVASSLGITDAEGQAATLRIAALPVLLTAMAFWVGLILCFWPPARRSVSSQDASGHMHPV